MADKNITNGVTYTQLITWTISGIAIIVPSIWASVNISEARSATFTDKLEERVYQYASDISALKEKTDNLDKKMDTLLNVYHIDGTKIK